MMVEKIGRIPLLSILYPPSRPRTVPIKGSHGVVINSWFDDSTGEKNIELVWSNPLREVGFIANGMTPSELKGRLEMEISAWEMVRMEKSED